VLHIELQWPRECQDSILHSTALHPARTLASRFVVMRNRTVTNCRSRDGPVSYRLVVQEIAVRFQAGAETFFFSKSSRSDVGPTQPPNNAHCCIFPVVKGVGEWMWFLLSPQVTVEAPREPQPYIQSPYLRIFMA